MRRKLVELNDWIGKKVAWITTFLVILICVDVFLRYLFNTSKVWIVELEWHLFALVFLLSAGYAFKHDQHVRVDLFYTRFSPRKKAWINLVGTLLFLIPWCIVIIATSTRYTYNSWLIGESSSDPGGLPARYLIKFSMVIGFVLLLYQGVLEVIKSIGILLKKEKE